MILCRMVIPCNVKIIVESLNLVAPFSENGLALVDLYTDKIKIITLQSILLSYRNMFLKLINY